MIKILSKIIKIKRLLVLGVNRTNENDIYYSLQVKKSNSSLGIIEAKEYDNSDDLIAGINPAIPIILVVDGKGILNKKIDSENEYDIAWKKNIDFNNLYFTSINCGHFEFFSLGRKEVIDDIISRLIQKKAKIIDFYIGPLTMSLLHPALQKDIIWSNGYVFEFSGKQLIDIKRDQFSEEVYTFNNIQLSSRYLPLYGAAVDFYVEQDILSKNRPIKLNSEEYIYEKSFNLFGAAILVLFFCSLLASYILIQYYSQENIKLNQENIFSNQAYQHIIELEKQRDEKITILNRTRQSSKKFLSFYAFEIAKYIPYGINVSEISVFPVEKIKSNQKISADSDYIFIKGFTLSESSFNSWIKILKAQGWIKKFEIISLKKDKKNTQHFEIKLIPDDF